MLEPFEHQGATGQEEFLGFTHSLAGTTEKNGHIVE